MGRKKVFAAIAVVALVAGSAGVANAAANKPASFRLVASAKADRSGAVALQGAQVSGNIAVFVTRAKQATSVTFYLDNPSRTKAFSTETLRPFDFAGTATDGTAKLFNSSSLSLGQHEIVAVRTLPSGKKSATRAVFTVINKTTPVTSTSTTSSPSTTSTTAAPVVSTTTTAAAPATTTTAAPASTSSKCAAYPAFPDANCTGPTGTLAAWTGGDEFRTDGQVVENVEIHTAGLYVPASNVVFRNCKIVYTGGLDATFTIVNVNNNHGTRFENCELDGQGKVARAISGSGVTVKNSEIHGVGNAIETDTPLDVEDNYIHDIKTADGTDWHADGIQTGSGADNVIVRHNTIILTGPETGAINIMGDANDPASNVLIENNLFAGGGYTMYAGPGTNYKVINNHFSTQVYPKVGYYNIWYWDPGQDGDVVRSGNVIHETGAPANTNL